MGSVKVTIFEKLEGVCVHSVSTANQVLRLILPQSPAVSPPCIRGIMALGSHQLVLRKTTV